ncbi:MAG TPA: hypothetical protein VJ783_25705 [Pirellulales bacterium]|nr:hypothetical protein [Pirellulales bacterium]
MAVLVQQTKTSAVRASRQQLESSRSRLAAAVDRLRRYLDTGGANGAAWKRYLRFDELSAAAGHPESVKSETLEEVYNRFRADQVGLELPVFHEVGLALRDWLDAVERQSHPVAQEDLDRRLEQLTDQLGSFQRQPNPDELAKIAAALGWLSRHGQASSLVAALRRRLSQPNLHVHLSQRLITAATDRPADDVEDVRDVILGTTVIGRGHTLGHVRTRLVPSERYALLETVIEAVNEAKTVGYNGPARVGSLSHTELNGRKRFMLDANGFAVWPANATAQTSSRTYGVWSNKHGCVDRLVRRVAQKRLGQQKAAGEHVAAQHARSRLERRLDGEANRQLAQSNTNYLERFRNPLFRTGHLPRELRFSTTAADLQLVALHDGPARLAAPLPPPEPEGGLAMSVRLHESLANNLAEDFLAGRTLDQDQLDQLAVRLFGRVPKQFVDDERRGPWSLTFAAHDPITLRIESDAAMVTIRGRRFASEDREFRTPMNITARYRLLREHDAVRAVREGEIEVLPPGFTPGRRIPPRLSTVRNLLKRRFERIFTPEIASQGLVLPGQWSRAGRLDLVQLDAHDGWLALGWVTSTERERRTEQ